MTTPRPEHHRTNGCMAVAIEDLRETCADLARMGCTVLDAHATHNRNPRIEIRPPHARVKLERGLLRITHQSITYATNLGGVQVEWTQPKRA